VRAEVTTASPYAGDADTLVIGVFADERVEQDFGGGMLQGLLDRGEARATFKHLALAHADSRRVLLVGLGARAQFDPERAREAAAVAHARALELGARTLCWQLPSGFGAGVAAGLVQGTLLHAYRFERYKPDRDSARVERLLIAAPAADLAEQVAAAATVTSAQNRARELGNLPANELPPSALADYATRLADRHEGVTVTVWDGAQIRDAGMGAFAAVAQGSDQDARMIQIDYRGPGADGPLLGMLGKGVTFDSGGLSLKPHEHMHEMKYDMCGAAAVIEAIAALAELGAPTRVLGLVGAAENLPSGRSVKPGDIVRALDGTTIEVDNTDAEGRLVLADCLCHARRQGCERLLDIATLTGAVVVALGSTYAGLMANQDGWAAQVQEAAAAAGEPVWRLPLHPEYARMVEGRDAQLTNRSKRREAMAITAAELLHHFAGGVPWAHLDIAGTAWDVPRPYFEGSGPTGFGVRLLVELAQDLARGPA
jgi:leucyl aminopeptidase